MKAEALLRKGNAAGALTIMNELRAIRGATPLASATLTNLLEERGREMFWEGWRRNDMIRFGKSSIHSLLLLVPLQHAQQSLVLKGYCSLFQINSSLLIQTWNRIRLQLTDSAQLYL